MGEAASPCVAFKDRPDAQVCGQVAKWAGLFLVSPGDLGIV